MSDWQSVCIGDIANIPKKQPIANPQAIELLTVRLHAKGVERTGKYPRATERGRPYFARDAGEILIGRQNFHNGGIGIVSKADHGLICSNAITSLIPTDRADKNFLFYLLSSSGFRKSIQKQSEGTGQSEISETRILSLELALPPLPEQKKIAEILSGIDRRVFALKTKADRLSLLYQGVSDKYFLDNIFNEVALGEVCSLIKDGTHLPPKRVSSGIPLLGVRNMKDGILTLLADDQFVSDDFYAKMHSNWVPERGDVLIATIGSIGAIARVPANFPRFTFTRNFAILRGKKGTLLNEYLYEVLANSSYIKKLLNKANQTAQAALYLSHLSQFKVPMPGIGTQEKVAKELSGISLAKRKIEDQRNHLIQLSSALAVDLLSGRKRVSV